MSGAADDWAYEHLGVFGWTTEFWVVNVAATGERSSTDIWYVGLTPEQELAIARWSDRYGELMVPWRPFEHPQLGAVEIGGLDWFHVATNPPLALLVDEIRPHAEFAVFQALAAPCVEIVHLAAVGLGDGLWRIEAGIANTGWLPTTVSARAKNTNMVLPLTAELELPEGVAIANGANRVRLGQLQGRSGFRVDGGGRSDGTPDRVLATWTVRSSGAASFEVGVVASHPRAGSRRRAITIE
jgi:hypothetical protein